MIRSRAMEAKFRRKGIILTDSFFHSAIGELFVRSEKRLAHDDCHAEKKENKEADEEMEEFASVQSHFSNCLSASMDSPKASQHTGPLLSVGDDTEVFFSVKTDFSCCSSLKDLEFAENQRWDSKGLDSWELKRREIIQEFCHCEGWPFGLCRKALLLPPLPKSPSESWSWCKGSVKIVKM